MDVVVDIATYSRKSCNEFCLHYASGRYLGSRSMNNNVFSKLVILFLLFFLSTVKADSPAGFHHNHGKNVRLMGEARDRAERSASYNQVNQGTKNWF